MNYSEAGGLQEGNCCKYQKYETTKQFKKKSCLRYDKLSTIFGDTIASGANQHPSTKSPSISDNDDGEEHDDDQDEHSSQPKRRHLLDPEKVKKVGYATLVKVLKQSEVYEKSISTSVDKIRFWQSSLRVNIKIICKTISLSRDVVLLAVASD
ncbi:hypothetical protein JHK86_006420 [Glycine max]|nr:hypothetical protein JHK86_006420 [Glycine max]